MCENLSSGIWEQLKGADQAAHMHSPDQRLCYSLIGKYHIRL